MKKKIIAVDIDDVLASSAQGFVDFSNNRWGTHLTVEDYNEHWGTMWQVDDEEYAKRAQMVYDSGAVRGFKVHDDAKDVLVKLSNKYSLVITTSRVKALETETKEWLNSHYQGIFDAIYLGGFYDTITSDSHLLTKADLCKSIGASYLIDDHPKHCFAAAKEGISALLFGSYPWNRNLKLSKGVIRVATWNEVLHYFNDQE